MDGPSSLSASANWEFDVGASRCRRVLPDALLALMLAAAGCTTSLRDWAHNGLKLGPNYAAPPAATAAQWIEQDDRRVQTVPATDCDWWSVFNDPVLNDLINTAYQQNLDLKAAGARILQARAERAIAAGNLFPQSQDALAAYAHAQVPGDILLPLPGSLDIWATGLNGSWELDFWGRYRRTVEAADAQVGVTVEDYHDALVMLLSEVATSYVQLRTYQERLQFAQQNVEIQKKSTQLAVDRFNAGTATELDVRQARSNLRQTESTIPPLVIGVRQAGDQLCALLGMAPMDLAGHLQPAPIPKAPAEVAVGIPADLLRRRPDIRRAEREVAQQCARIGVAEADLYPRFSINGFLGYAANDFKDLFAAQSVTGFVIPNVQWNLLNYGRLINNVRSHDAQYQEAVYQYQQKVLNAGRDVEDGLVSFLQTQQQAMSLDQGVAETARAVELVVEQFQVGITDFNRVYNTESLLVTQQDDLAQARGKIALSLINVYRALGGGWQQFDPCCAPACGSQPQEGASNAAATEPIGASKPAGPGATPQQSPIKPDDTNRPPPYFPLNLAPQSPDSAEPLPAVNSNGP